MLLLLLLPPLLRLLLHARVLRLLRPCCASDFGEFCKVIANQKAATAQQNDEVRTGAHWAQATHTHRLTPTPTHHTPPIPVCRSTLSDPRTLTTMRVSLLAVSLPPSPRQTDTVDAFIALGGSADKTGNVSADKLRTIIKDFGLTIDIDRLIREVDTDHSGLIDYQEFAVMMKS